MAKIGRMQFRKLIVLTCVATALPAATANAATLKAPTLQTPAADAAVQAVPSFTWKRVKGAASYDFQLAGDRRFGSIVLGTGRGRGSFRTRNTAATIGKTLTDGTYYWRVRAVTAKDKAGRWSAPRVLTKSWKDAPQIVGPTDDLKVNWPLAPLVLQWSAVAHATGYQVSIATDPGMSNVVFGDAAKPVQTQGTVLAFPTTLAPGPYYWAVTPVNAQGHKGTRSRTARFAWGWNTHLDEPQLRVTDLDPAAAVFDPQLSWDTIPGAASYDVEVSSDQDFAQGSTVCCADRTIGTSISPPKLLANNTGSSGEAELQWRVRAVDAAGNAQDWSYGPAFDETYPATIDDLRVVRDNPGDAAAGSGGEVPDTAVPIVTWSQVPGASSYEVRVVPYEAYGCNWSASTPESWDVVTASTSWTPLSSPGNHRPVGVLTDLLPSRDTVPMIDGRSYCVRVRAQRDRDVKNRPVVSDWTTINERPDGAGAAFRYTAAPVAGTLRPTAAQDYLLPAMGSAHTWTPLFTWKPVDGARGYFVVVARDSAFTKVVDLAYTTVPAYAPRRNKDPWTYADESEAYWWAVVPTAEADGDGAVPAPTQDAPRWFSKNSDPAQSLQPAQGATVARQPVFRWTPALGARSYTIQVDQDPTFRTPVVNVTTASTGYTASGTLPADTALYWRVRANDERNIGLRWSEVRTFRRTLPVPALADENPSEGTQIPLLQWKPVQGAVAYDMHIEQPDGTSKDFTLRSTAFTPVQHYGTGIWTWMVRARFPTTSNQTVPGGYSAAIGFLRHLNPPTGVQALRNSSRTLISWNPDTAAERYRVETAATDGFGDKIEVAVTDNTSWAPDLTRTAYQTTGKIYWRVALVDSGNTVGAYATGVFTLLRPPMITVSGKPRQGRRGRLRVTVASPARRAIAKARVSIRGAGSKPARKLTGKAGAAAFRVRPRKRGFVAVKVEARGYRTTTVRVRVRKR
jgi:hypothetical protein